jgi:NAD+ kinase
LLPHTLFSRPLIVPASSHIEIGCDSPDAHAHLECDGDAVSEVAPATPVLVARHPKTVRFARTAPLQFFKRLEEKLRWGVSIKERLR